MKYINWLQDELGENYRWSRLLGTHRHIRNRIQLAQISGLSVFSYSFHLFCYLLGTRDRVYFKPCTMGKKKTVALGKIATDCRTKMNSLRFPLFTLTWKMGTELSSSPRYVNCLPIQKITFGSVTILLRVFVRMCVCVRVWHAISFALREVGFEIGLHFVSISLPC